MSVSTRRSSLNGLKKYPASEYSDRIINLNKIEDKNLENALKYIEKERNQVLHNLNRDIKKLEEDCEEREEQLRMAYNLERKKFLNSNLHNNILLNTKSGYDKFKKHTSSKKFKHDSDPSLTGEREFKENNSRSIKNLSANIRLSKQYTDPSIMTSNIRPLNISRSKSSSDLFKQASPIMDIKDENKTQFLDIVEQRANSTDFVTRRSKNENIDLTFSIGNLKILPKAPISISERVVKKNFNFDKNKRTHSNDSNSTDESKARNISPLSASSSPVPQI